MTGLSQVAVAMASGASLATIKRLEVDDGVLRIRRDTLGKIQGALEGAGVDFIAENGGGPGVRMIAGYPERLLPSDEGITFLWRGRDHLGDEPAQRDAKAVRISATTLKDLGLPVDSREAIVTTVRLSARFIVEKVEALASKRLVAGAVRLRAGDLVRR
jgi:hypothetical protein